MSYFFYLDKVLLPVAPSKMSLKIRNQNKTMNLINEGEVNIIREAGLTEISFSAEIPAAERPYATYKNGFIKPSEFMSEFERLKSDKKPFQFIVTRTRPDGQILFDTNIQMTLEAYSIEENVNDGFDVRVTFDLKQYKEYGTKIITVDKKKKTIEKTSLRSSKTMTKAKSYKVVAGDSLWSIAKKHYGDGAKYTQIYAANQALIDNRNKGTGLSKYTIYAGQVLTIPA